MFSCKDYYIETVTYKINEPIMMSREDFVQSARVSSVPQPIENHGKICFYNGYIFMAESGKGIHIINNLNPQNPHRVGFVELIGNADISVRNNVLYADTHTDLVWFSLAEPAAPVLQGRVANIFPTMLPIPDNGFGYDYAAVQNRSGDEIIVGWTLVERTEDIKVYRGGGWWGGWFDVDFNNPAAEGGTIAPPSSNGINGSMSRFSLYRDYLYCVINNQMSIIDLSGAIPVKAVENMYIGWNVETIFSYQDKMFMGTPTGMLIYSVANPLQPTFCSSMQHVFGCDPVVVQDDIAYVTIHSGNNCGQNSNELIIYNVADVYRPVEIVSYAMTKPKGLGIDNKTLFVCDDGLKIFNAQNPQAIMAPQNILQHYTGMSGYDVIPFNNILIMIAEDGLYQYDYSDLNNIYQLSVINW
jgi:hypothetical protein